MAFVFDDGGREKAGFKGTTGDCCCRAFTIASGLPYKEVYNLINKIGRKNAYKAGRSGNGISTARNGVYKDDAKELAAALGFRWVPTMSIGSGCKMHLNSAELPKGRIVCNVSKHFVAAIDGVIHDTYDSSREGERCVYGYWIAPERKTAKDKLHEFVDALTEDQAEAFREYLYKTFAKED